MLKTEIRMDVSQVQRKLQDLAMRKIPGAALRTVNDLAFAIRADTYDAMRKRFDRPSSFTLRSMEVIKGNSKASPSAWVGLRRDPYYRKALAHEFSGGLREWKRMEGALYRRGILTKGEGMVPAAGCPLDANGNPRSGFVVQMLAYFSAYGEAGYKSNMTASSRPKFNKRFSRQQKIHGAVEFFVSRGKGMWTDRNGVQRYQKLPRGIYMRVKFGSSDQTAIKPVFLFVKLGAYQQRIDLEHIGRMTVQAKANSLFAGNLSKAIAYALGDYG